MTKKHFIQLADMIRERNYLPNGVPTNHEERVQGYVIEMLAGFCESVNPEFKRDRWIDYIEGKCGPNGGAR